MNLILIAGLKSGREIAKYFLKDKNTNLLKVYVLKDELGTSIPDFVKFDDIIPGDKLKKVDNINNYAEEIKNMKPDLIVVVGWSQLLSEDIIKCAKIGAIGFHPSKLPKDRGRSTLAWQIVEGYEKGCVSMFWLDAGIDSGDIIGQMEYEITYYDTIRDVLDKVYSLCVDLIKTYYPMISKGNIIRIKQDESKATYRRKRGKEDSIINWNRTSREIYNLIRAITYPYPGAITYYNGTEITVLEAYEYDEPIYYEDIKPGTILEIKYNKGVLVKAKDKAILLKKIRINDEYIEVHDMQKIFNVGCNFDWKGE
ncbi:MAG TPA: methionyl-tRNA formyltransferase [Tissierellaceae bacterium]